MVQWQDSGLLKPKIEVNEDALHPLTPLYKSSELDLYSKADDSSHRNHRFASSILASRSHLGRRLLCNQVRRFDSDEGLFIPPWLKGRAPGC